MQIEYLEFEYACIVLSFNWKSRVFLLGNPRHELPNGKHKRKKNMPILDKLSIKLMKEDQNNQNSSNHTYLQATWRPEGRQFSYV